MVDNSKQGRRVLVVDDCPQIRAAFELGLKLFGYDVKTAGDGLTGLEAAVTFRPHAMIIDLALPVIDGWQLAERIASHTFFKRPKLIALTGLSLASHRARSLAVGFAHHVLKPISLPKLAELLA